ncbi:hypothetical protein Y032_0485g2329 [Ancylostoma ceylanicum]|nr:hypothetical protein Y032_0485g2329 [Ancylostoma ceylanicum]
MDFHVANEEAEVYEGPNNGAYIERPPAVRQQCKSKGKWAGIRMTGNQFFTHPAPWTTFLSAIMSKLHTVLWTGRFMRY